MYSPLLTTTQTSIKVSGRQGHKLRAEYSLAYNTPENSSSGLISWQFSYSLIKPLELVQVLVNYSIH